jgi:hypothetical protein
MSEEQPSKKPRKRSRKRRKKVQVNAKQIVTLSDRPGAFILIRRGRQNSRIASTATPDSQFLVADTLINTEGEGATASPEAVEDMGDSFDILAQLTTCVAKGYSNGVFVTGPGGTGKTYTILQSVERAGMKKVDDQGNGDYVVIKGYSTAAAMFNELYTHRDKLVIFDDCDSVLNDPTGLNILKAVLDTYPIRTVSWNTNSPLITCPVYDFTGQIIFISNKDPSKLNASQSALKTRVFHVHLAGTPEQMRDRCVELMPEIVREHGKGELNLVAVEELQKYVLANYEQIRNLSLRFAVNLVSIRRFNPTGWKVLARKLR